MYCVVQLTKVFLLELCVVFFNIHSESNVTEHHFISARKGKVTFEYPDKL